MESSGYEKRRRFLQDITRPMGARGKMFVCSIAILLLAAAVLLGVIAALCLLVIKCGIIEPAVYEAPAGGLATVHGIEQIRLTHTVHSFMQIR